MHQLRNKNVNKTTKAVTNKLNFERLLPKNESMENPRKIGIARIKMLAKGKVIKFIPYTNL
jgi:hypothetical protein